jgi:hypothetical protein
MQFAGLTQNPKKNYRNTKISQSERKFSEKQYVQQLKRNQKFVWMLLDKVRSKSLTFDTSSCLCLPQLNKKEKKMVCYITISETGTQRKHFACDS